MIFHIILSVTAFAFAIVAGSLVIMIVELRQEPKRNDEQASMMRSYCERHLRKLNENFQKQDQQLNALRASLKEHQHAN